MSHEATNSPLPPWVAVSSNSCKLGLDHINGVYAEPLPTWELAMRISLMLIMAVAFVSASLTASEATHQCTSVRTPCGDGQNPYTTTCYKRICAQHPPPPSHVQRDRRSADDPYSTGYISTSSGSTPAKRATGGVIRDHRVNPASGSARVTGAAVDHRAGAQSGGVKVTTSGTPRSSSPGTSKPRAGSTVDHRRR